MLQQNSTPSPAIHRKAHNSAVLMARAVFEVSVASHPMPCCNVPACRHVAIDYATHQRVISGQHGSLWKCLCRDGATPMKGLGSSWTGPPYGRESEHVELPCLIYDMALVSAFFPDGSLPTPVPDITIPCTCRASSTNAQIGPIRLLRKSSVWERHLLCHLSTVSLPVMSFQAYFAGLQDIDARGAHHVCSFPPDVHS